LVAAVASSRASIDPQWLKDLVPGFADPEVGLIQAPQDHRDGCRRSQGYIRGGELFKKNAAGMAGL
jgi:hypothetical protein